jgi:ABC-2 type transport system ATP-binding protein
MYVIEAEDLWKRFKVRGRVIEALRGLHLSIAEGEIFGLLGPNGAGKTTTLRILTTLLSPERGRARVAGHQLLREPRRVRACIGYVSRFGGADYMMTGRENLILQAQLYGLSRSAARLTHHCRSQSLCLRRQRRP